MKTNEIFEKFLNEIKDSLNPSTYSIWFKDFQLIKMDDKEIQIKVPIEVYKKALLQHMDMMDEILFSLTGINYKFTFLTPEDIKSQIKEEENNKDNNIVEWNTNLNTNLNFENFIVGESNRLAFVSAMSVAQSPGTIHNPLFIYGRSGVGKTHLMHAIGNYITNNSDKKVLYTTSNDYVTEFSNISKIEKGAQSLNYANNFKSKYRNVDVLIIDDIQFLVGAELTQQEFFHTFNTLHQSNKQIIISSDRSPDDLKKIEDRLRSRFTWGLPVDIYPPDFELRCELIKHKLNESSIKDRVNKDVIEYIANASTTDIRHIFGTINRLLVYTALNLPEVIDLDFAIEALNDYLNTNIYQENTISHIQKVVADYFKITVEDLKSKKRSNNIAKPRQIAMYLSRIETDENLSKIGLEFGGRDHSTVISSCEKIKKELLINNNLDKMLKEIKQKL